MDADSLRRKAAALKDMAKDFRAGGIDISTIPPEHHPAIKQMIECYERIIGCHQELGDEYDCLLRRLEHLNKELKQLKFGKSSEKLGKEERELAAEDIEEGIAKAEAGIEAVNKKRPAERRPAKRNIGNLPGNLQRVETISEPDNLTCCGKKMKRMSEERHERLVLEPKTPRVDVTVCPRYQCKCCRRIVYEKAPPRLIKGGIPTEGTLAHVAVSKFLHHLPLYRQSAMLADAGIDIHRSVLAGWMGQARFHLQPIVDAMDEELKEASVLFMDETTVPVLSPGTGKTKLGYFWVMARDSRPWGGDDPPGMVCRYSQGRGGQHAEDFLRGFDGTLHVDGYDGYNRLTTEKRKGGKPIKRAFCWAHVRRKCKEVHDRDSAPDAKEGLRIIAEIYKIERDIRGFPPDERLAARKERTRPLVAEFFIWLRRQMRAHSPKSRFGEKLAYIRKRRRGLTVFVRDGRVEIDNNTVENVIRPIVITRKNSLFAGHDEGAATWACFSSLIGTCKMNGIDPYLYLKVALEALAKDPFPDPRRAREMSPLNFARLRREQLNRGS